MIHSKNSYMRLWQSWACIVAQLCPAPCCSVKCSLPSSSVHGTFQARVLSWVAISSSRGSSQLRGQTRVSCLAGRFLTVPWAAGEAVATLLKLIEYCINLGKSLYILLSRHTIRNSHCCASHVCLVGGNYFMSLTWKEITYIFTNILSLHFLSEELSYFS